MNIPLSSRRVSKTSIPAEPARKPLVLFITPTMPLLSGKGSSMRAGMHVLALAHFFEVHVLILSRFGKEKGLVPEPELKKKMASMKTIETPTPQHGKSKALSPNMEMFRRLFMSPRLGAKFSDHETTVILKLLKDQKFDMILFGRLSTGRLMENDIFRKWVGNTPRILDIDDIESEAAMREAKATRIKRGRIGHLNDLLDALKLALIERRLFRHFDEILVCSKSDQIKMMRRHPKHLFNVLPNGFRVPSQPLARHEPDVLTLLFVGFLQYLPNAEGIQFFCKEVIPLLRDRLDRPFRLLVVGRKPPQAVLDLERIPEVSVIGDVPEVEPYYQTATMAIVPIRFGGGTRIKILEAMALGCPIVSTTLGAEGIEVHNGEDILLADTAADIADACIRLAEDAALRESLSRSGRDVVRRLYSVEAIAKRMADCIKAVSVRV